MTSPAIKNGIADHLCFSFWFAAFGAGDTTSLRIYRQDVKGGEPNDNDDNSPSTSQSQSPSPAHLSPEPLENLPRQRSPTPRLTTKARSRRPSSINGEDGRQRHVQERTYQDRAFLQTPPPSGKPNHGVLRTTSERNKHGHPDISFTGPDEYVYSQRNVTRKKPRKV